MLNLVLLLSISHTGHWKFNIAPHGKELSEDLKKVLLLSGAREQGVLRVLQHPLFFSVGNCKLL